MGFFVPARCAGDDESDEGHHSDEGMRQQDLQNEERRRYSFPLAAVTFVTSVTFVTFPL